MAINAFLNVYEEKDHIIDTLNSIQPHVDAMWILDGTVKQFPAQANDRSFAEASSSRDGTVEQIKEWMKQSRIRVHFYESREIWENEAVKKNYLLDRIPENDYVIQLDGDEELFSGVSLKSLVASYPNEPVLQAAILFRGHASFKPLSYRAWTQPRITRNRKNRRFAPPRKEQLINFGNFSSQPVIRRPDTSTVISRPIDPSTFSGEQKLIEQAPKTVAPVLPLYITNNPSIRSIERQKRRLIYYSRIFGINWL